MRQITKTLQLPVGGKPFTFRLRKLDALSGACLLRLLARADRNPSPDPGAADTPSPDLGELLFSSLSDEELRALMVRCLEQAEVLLDAGWQPVMQLGEWSWSDLQYDPAGALSLTLKEIVWSLDGFFAGSRSDSPPARPGS
ncbi:MAG: hypothetical protein E7325_08175 [Clostridiales bacterium]|nr:hypothetical protein [Clostridiales bacterium]